MRNSWFVTVREGGDNHYCDTQVWYMIGNATRGLYNLAHILSWAAPC
jgi:hypothetical protein